MTAMLLFPISLLVARSLVTECPDPTANLRSRKGDPQQFPILFKNTAPIDVSIRWVNFDGAEVNSGVIAPGDTTRMQTFANHVFRFYSRGGVLISEIVVPGRQSAALVIEPCSRPGDDDFLEPKLFDEGRDVEFAALSHSLSQECSPADNSRFWSCIRYTPKEKLHERDSSRFGFADKNEAGHREVGETVDIGYVSHIPDIRVISNGPGFLKMDQTDGMKKALSPWYQERKKDSLKIHPPIPGGYTNSHAVSMSKIDLDHFPEKRHEIVEEMQQVLQWWTNQTLRHTSTFGIRIYHRNAMLINHVDRADTHLASAVIQVDQEVDENGGWPLEVLDDDGNVYEVFLQPGEMVLYEGARLRHGRPMRFRGTDFANIFSHFAPMDWAGPNAERKRREEL